MLYLFRVEFQASLLQAKIMVVGCGLPLDPTLLCSSFLSVHWCCKMCTFASFPFKIKCIFWGELFSFPNKFVFAGLAPTHICRGIMHSVQALHLFLLFSNEQPGLYIFGFLLVYYSRILGFAGLEGMGKSGARLKDIGMICLKTPV